jgi:hypothetical protein
LQVHVARWRFLTPASLPVPPANPRQLTATANRLILAPDERSLQIDLVRLDRTVPVAGCVGSRDPCPSTPTQRAAAQIPHAIGVRRRWQRPRCGRSHFNAVTLESSVALSCRFPGAAASGRLRSLRTRWRSSDERPQISRSMANRYRCAPPPRSLDLAQVVQ